MQNHRQIAFTLLNDMAKTLNKVNNHFNKGFNPNDFELENVHYFYKEAVKKIKDIKYDLNRHDLAYSKDSQKFLMYAADKYKLADRDIIYFNSFAKHFLTKKNVNTNFTVCNIVMVVVCATILQLFIHMNNLSCAT
jgi:hypothetical protein